jgi:LysR family transcriptional activator of nhaA
MGAEMVEVLHDRLKPAKLSLCIGALDAVPKQVVLRLIKAAIQFMPCQITLIEGRPDELLRELTAHRVDLLVTHFVPTASDAQGIFHRSLSRKNVAIYGAPKFNTLRKGFPDSISDVPMIVPTYDSKLRYDLDHWSKTVGVQLDVLMESQDISIKKLMAVNQLGLIPAAYHTVAKQVLTGELVEIGKLRGVYEELLLVTAQRKIENPLAQHLMQSFHV